MAARLLAYSKILIIIPLVITLGMAVCFLVLETTFVTTMFFFFVAVPFLAYLLCTRLGLRRSDAPLLAMTTYYAWLVFLSYQHIGSDFFVIVLLSAIYNLFIMMLVMLSQNDKNRNEESRERS